MSNRVIHFRDFEADRGECGSNTLIGSAIVAMAAAIVTTANVVMAPVQVDWHWALETGIRENVQPKRHWTSQPARQLAGQLAGQLEIVFLLINH